ncbi:Ig-like domain repeat protein [Nocardioides mangrovi]|uniref:Ig-like domain repeat protein n=1 Tax=Nocardioides mangrovi TaxID=2874580 RepID=A0ABS7UEB2_9ACTN|nr:Ig-like domain repeat protein [Nocardioides mangrovi]MBZ5739222.1 Ig-like domain repeat protein [Nocardioides mangrovi]
MHVRTVVAAVAAAGLCVVPFAMSADAATSHPQATAAAPHAAASSPLIKGVVVDQSGKAIDDVKVQALDKKGKPVASALTYASQWASGPQHGFFFVEVGAKGTYSLTLSKSGYDTRTISGLEVTKRRLALGELTLKKTLPSTKTTAELSDKSITTKEKGEIEVKVSTSATKRPTGDIEILEGRRVVGEATLKAGAKGEVSVVLDKLGVGSHHLVASYLGSSSLKASKSGSVTLVVKKPRR